MNLEYLKMSPLEKFWFNLKAFFKRLPSAFSAFFQAIPKKLKKLWLAFAGIFVNIGKAAKEGDWKTRTSFAVMGFGLICRKQYLKGILYLFFEVLFVLYMVFFGWKYLAKMGSLGEVACVTGKDPMTGITTYTYYDNSLLILLYSLLTIFVIAAFVYMWYHNVKGNFLSQQFREARLHLADTKDEIRSYADENYHKTLLSIPILGLVVFTILPIFFMIFIAFTNYDKAHMPPSELFQWVGFENFVNVLGGGISANSKVFAFTFTEVLLWTVVWAFFRNVFQLCPRNGRCDHDQQKGREVQETVAYRSRDDDRDPAVRFPDVHVASAQRPGIVQQSAYEVGLDRSAHPVFNGRDACKGHDHHCQYVGGDSLFHADLYGNPHEYPRRSVRVGKNGRRWSRKSVYKDNASLHAPRDRALPDHAVYRQFK